jgi:hypothetical protein
MISSDGVIFHNFTSFKVETIMLFLTSISNEVIKLSRSQSIFDEAKNSTLQELKSIFLNHAKSTQKEILLFIQSLLYE